MRAAKLKITQEALRGILQLPDGMEIVGIGGDASVYILYLIGESLPEVPEYGPFPEVLLKIMREVHPDCPGYQKITTALEGT